MSTFEANVNKGWHKALLKSTSADTMITEFYTGRPTRVLKNENNVEWKKRGAEMQAYLESGTVPL